jgi:NADH-quinone oxidoreductase subunit L
MTIPLIILGVLSIVAGLVIVPDIAQSLGMPSRIVDDHEVFGFGVLVFNPIEGPESWHWNTGLALASTVTALGGIAFTAWLLSVPGRMQRFTAAIPGLYALVKNKFYFDEMYQWLIDRVVLVTAFGIAWFDRHIINDTGVDGGSNLTNYFGYRLKFAQTGRIPNYALAIVVGVLALAVIAFTTRT